MVDCVFCNREEIQEDILFETNHFLVKVGIGIITPGHVLLIPKQHYRTFAGLPEPLEAEFECIKEKLKEKIRQSFSDPILFEDGNWRQSVKHAHIHFIPSKNEKYEAKNVIQEMCLAGGINVERVNRKRLKELYLQIGKYFSIEEGRNLYVCHLPTTEQGIDPPHLSYRVFFTERKGITGVRDWQKMPAEEREADEIKRKITKEKLRIALNQDIERN